ncbi:MAG: cytochrome P450/oxidoreductase [Salinibacterium sp.]|nr:cytochrome P450/oxidoreductase [Salinibacterium sp.]
MAYLPAAEVWFITRFQDCSDVGNGQYGFVAASGHPTLERVFNKPNVLTSDGEVHTDLRAGIDPRLKPDAVTEVVDDIVRPVARRRLEALRGRTSGDLMEDYFEPVSVEALRRVMGLDELVDADTLRRWFAGLNTGIANFGLRDEEFALADSVSAEIEHVIIPLIDELTAHPDDSMISHMIWAGVRDGKPRSVATIMPSLKVILLGGMQEPGHGAASTLHGLFGQPEQLAKATADPLEWAPLAVNEGLRWLAPIGAIERQATEDVRFGDVTIPAGAIVEVMIASANRDETRFDEPDVFDMERSTRTHQAFGAGSHFCAGHFFARQVERIMFEELLPGLPGLRRSSDTATEVSGWFFRAPQVLPVEWDAVTLRESIAINLPPLPRGTALLEVGGVRREADGVVSLELRHPDGADLPEWQPGAHIDLWPIQERGGQYSLCGDPTDRSSWRVAVLREPDSRGVSSTIHDSVRVGTRLPVGGPRNNFALEPAPAYLFIAGGIGITPLLPMARRAAQNGIPFDFHYTGRSLASMAFLDELPDGAYVHGAGERLDLVETLRAAPAGALVYCCGPDRMLDAVVSAGELLGVDVRVERFAGVDAIREGDVALEVGLARSGETLAVPADRSILGALQDRGIEVLTACGEGNCGSCETRVLAGRIEHRDVLLTPAQRAKGDRMMVCVSRGEGLVLDL